MALRSVFVSLFCLVARALDEQTSYCRDSTIFFNDTYASRCSNECLTNGYLHGEEGACNNICDAPGGIEELEETERELFEHDDSFGVVQARDTTYNVEIEQTLVDMKHYFQNLRSDPSTTPNMLSLLDHCKNEHQNCAFWKVLGECENVSWLKEIAESNKPSLMGTPFLL